MPVLRAGRLVLPGLGQSTAGCCCCFKPGGCLGLACVCINRRLVGWAFLSGLLLLPCRWAGCCWAARQVASVCTLGGWRFVSGICSLASKLFQVGGFKRGSGLLVFSGLLRFRLGGKVRVALCFTRVHIRETGFFGWLAAGFWRLLPGLTSRSKGRAAFWRFLRFGFYQRSVASLKLSGRHAPYRHVRRLVKRCL